MNCLHYCSIKIILITSRDLPEHPRVDYRFYYSVVNLGQRCDVHVHVTTQSEPTCLGDTQSEHGSPAASQVLCTPAALSRYKSVGVDWSKRKAKTPDLLAEIMVRQFVFLALLSC